MKRLFNFCSSSNNSSGFTLIELIVSIGIFMVLTTLMVVKYGSFNGSVLLTNLAYDVAITIRTAQTYGLSVKNISTNNSTPNFQSGYGVHFDTVSLPTKIILFIDTNNNGLYNAPNEIISEYNLKRGAKITSICASTTSDECTHNSGWLSITFKRPNPDAVICLFECPLSNGDPIYTYAEIIIKGTDNSIRKVSVRENGQISVIEQ